MGFFDTYGTPQAVAKSSKPETVLQALLRGCEQQRLLLSGKAVANKSKQPIIQFVRQIQHRCSSRQGGRDVGCF